MALAGSAAVCAARSRSDQETRGGLLRTSCSSGIGTIAGNDADHHRHWGDGRLCIAAVLAGRAPPAVRLWPPEPRIRAVSRVPDWGRRRPDHGAAWRTSVTRTPPFPIGYLQAWHVWTRLGKAPAPCPPTSRCCRPCGRGPATEPRPQRMGRAVPLAATTARHGCRRIAGRSSPAPSRSRSAQPMSTICFWGRKAGSYAHETAGGTGPSKRRPLWSVPVFALAFAADGQRALVFDRPGDLLAAKPGPAGGRRRLLRAQRRPEPSFAAAKPVASIWPGWTGLFRSDDWGAFVVERQRRPSPRKSRQRYLWCTARRKPYTRSLKAGSGRAVDGAQKLGEPRENLCHQRRCSWP